MPVHILGIRHHGVGSAKNLKHSLQKIHPDIILIEGPETANDIIHFAIDVGMKPPVAILLYENENNKNCVYYPFSIFSPEWQAIIYGLENSIPVKFIDIILDDKDSEDLNSENSKKISLEESPFEWISKELGYQDSEKLWEDIIESKEPDIDTFEAISSFFENIRREYKEIDKNTLIREAYMRKNISKYKQEGFKNIAVVCGAFHSTVLKNEFSDNDKQILENITEKSYNSIWVPWSYTRLCFYSGYGAGVDSPGWYHHLWENDKDIATKFISKIAFLLRNKKIDVSSDGVIESVNLSLILANLRGKQHPNLNDILESVQAALCNGNRELIKLISNELIVGNVFGKIPSNAPVTLIQKDFYEQLENCNLSLEFEKKDIKLDLTNEFGIKRSKFFYRISLLEIPFARPKFKINLSQRFREDWLLQWKEGYEIFVIEKGAWGNSIEEAARSYSLEIIKNNNDIIQLTYILAKLIGADINDILDIIIAKIQEETINSDEIEKLILIFPSLVQTYKYSNIRKIDQGILEKVIISIFNKINLNLLNLCINLDESTFETFVNQLTNLDYYISVFDRKDYINQWYKTLDQILQNPNTHSLISGYCCRLLFEKKIISFDKTKDYLNFFLLKNDDYFKSSFWVQGFLKNSIHLLIHNPELLQVINQWLCNMEEDDFMNCLPMLKKAFSDFTKFEKNKIAKMINTNNKILDKKADISIDNSKAEKVLPILKNIFSKKNNS